MVGPGLRLAAFKQDLKNIQFFRLCAYGIAHIQCAYVIKLRGCIILT